MHLSVVTPKGQKVDLDVTEVTAPGELGDLGILPGHRALLSGVGIGMLSYRAPGSEPRWLAVNGGYVEVADDMVVVITETAETPDEIDLERAEAARSRAEAKLKTVEAGRTEEAARVQASLRRAENRITAAKKKKAFVPA